MASASVSLTFVRAFFAESFIFSRYVKASNTGASDKFGTSVSLSGDGDVLAVGAPGESSGATGFNGDQVDNDVQDSGAVYTFTRNDSTWTQQAYVFFNILLLFVMLFLRFIKANDTRAIDKFGSLVSVSGNGALAVAASGRLLTFCTGFKSEAFAGEDKKVCQQSFVNLNATFSSPATGGQWSVVSGRGSFFESSNPTTNFTLSSDSATLRWTSTGSGCSVSSNVVIRSVPPAVVNTTTSSDRVCLSGAVALIGILQNAPGGIW